MFLKIMNSETVYYFVVVLSNASIWKIHQNFFFQKIPSNLRNVYQAGFYVFTFCIVSHNFTHMPKMNLGIPLIKSIAPSHIGSIWGCSFLENKVSIQLTLFP